jgi:glycosyltransferase involved in cell wall biosynthesis
MRKIKVLLLLHDLSPTGAPKVAAAAFEALRDQIDLWTITYQDGPLRERLGKLGRVQTLVSYRWPGMPAAPRALVLFLLHRFLSLGKARLWSLGVKRWRPDLVYVNSIAGLLAAKRLQLPQVPVLLHVHELDSFLYPFSQHAPELLRDLPDRYVAVSQAVATALIERYGIPAEKVVVIPAFVEEFPLPPARPPAEDTRLVVGGAGVVSWVKGPELWLLMAAEVKRQLGAAHVRFVWVGIPDGEAGWQFGEMARKLGLAEDVEMVRFTDCPLDYYAAFDIFAMTSWQDSFPLVVLETMLLEKPVVCFGGSGGACEEVGDAGTVIAEFSPAVMASAVIALAADPLRRAALGAAARRRVLENFTAAKQTPHLWREIETLTGASSSAAHPQAPT